VGIGLGDIGALLDQEQVVEKALDVRCYDRMQHLDPPMGLPLGPLVGNLMPVVKVR
jgi:hypothetical protein